MASSQTALSLITVAEAARRLTISLRSIRAAIAAGRLPVVYVSARRIAIDEADLLEFVAARRKCTVDSPQLPLVKPGARNAL
jgi:excisionase family DNA binding protein